MSTGKRKRPDPSSTIRDVAAAAEVSVSTVSLALNAPERVAEQTRARVLAAADALAFVPKAQAVASARRGVGRIGVVGPFTTYSAASRRLAGVLRRAAKGALEVVVFDRESSARRTAPLLASLPRTGRLDGLLIVSLPLDDAIVGRVRDLALPTVLVDAHHRGLSSVRTDDRDGGRLVAEHLLERGHRRFGFVGEAQRSNAYVSPAQLRLDGYRAALAEAGYGLVDDHLMLSARTLPAGTVAARELLTRRARPTAVFASDDLLAAAVLAAAHQLGLRVPNDMAVVGFDDGELAQALDLTTVQQPLEETGRLGLDQLRRQMQERGPAQDSVLELSLAVRGSS